MTQEETLAPFASGAVNPEGPGVENACEAHRVGHMNSIFQSKCEKLALNIFSWQNGLRTFGIAFNV